MYSFSALYCCVRAWVCGWGRATDWRRIVERSAVVAAPRKKGCEWFTLSGCFSFPYFIFNLGKERRRIPGGGGWCGRDHSKRTLHVYLQNIDFLWEMNQKSSDKDPALLRWRPSTSPSSRCLSYILLVLDVSGRLSYQSDPGLFCLFFYDCCFPSSVLNNSPPPFFVI